MDQILSDQLYLPQFIHIGFPKAASTWLRANLSAHPEIDFLFKTHFFHPLYGSNYDKGIDYYINLFSDLSIDHIIGESDEHLVAPDFNEEIGLSACNLEKFEQVITRIQQSFEILPKIIIIVRNQLDLLISTYSEYIYGGGFLLPFNFYYHVLNNYTKFLDLRYNLYLTILNEKFNRQNILLLLQEDIENDPAKELNTIYRFLGANLDINPSIVDKKHRVGFTRWGLKILRFINLVMQVIKFQTGSFQFRVKTHINTILKQLIFEVDNRIFKRLIRVTQTKKRAQIPKIIISKIKNIYANDNFCLAQLSNRNLDTLGYYTKNQKK